MTVTWNFARSIEMRRLRSDIGAVSYNETPLKGIVAPGITTMQTDFAHMGSSGE